MKAILHRCYGDPSVLTLETVARPAVGDNDVLVKVHAASINPVDWHYTRGTPYVMRRRLLVGPTGLPCTPPPFGALVAVSLATGRVVWDVPLGTMAPLREGTPPPPVDSGSPNLGGPITTASGLVFIGATLDRMIRAFDTATGKELWKAPLPAGARATPMTYEAGGRQFVAIAAGGSGPFGTGDEIVAFSLPAR